MREHTICPKCRTTWSGTLRCPGAVCGGAEGAPCDSKVVATGPQAWGAALVDKWFDPNDPRLDPDMEARELITDEARVLESIRQAFLVVEPMYSLRVAAELIPLGLDKLESFLREHADDFLARYHTLAHEGRGAFVRMLKLSECLRIREMVIKPKREARRKAEARISERG